MNYVKLTMGTALIVGGLLSKSFAQQITIPVETKNFAMVMQTDKNNRLKIIHTGKSIQNKQEYVFATSGYRLPGDGAESDNNAFTVAGIDNNVVEPAIAVVHNDGNNSLDLRYESSKTNTTSDGATTTIITLKDAVYPFYIDLNFKAWKNEDVVEQWTTIRHTEKGKVTLNKYASANLYFFNDDYYLTSYNTNWIKEMQPATTQLKEGMHTIQSRMGTRTDLFSSRNFMLALDRPASENIGTVMMGQLAWTGNYAIQFETDPHKKMHLVAGINPYQSAYELASGASFETPKLIYTISFTGTGTGSRNLHTWLKNHQLLDGNGSRLTLLNNWEATYHDFDQEKLVGLFNGAKELGVDMFLLDDGWFGNKYPRNDDHVALGDWQENRKKLPDGIPYLVKESGKLGLKFGIWVEPEMVSPKSELYEKKADWVVKEEKRPEIYFRNQLVLDLTNPEVQDHVFGVIDNLFIKNPNLAFIKWDCNAPIFNAHSKYLEKNKIPQSHFYIEYNKGLEKVLQRIRKKYPNVPMMLCAGGGSRTDYNMLKYFTELWPSDNTEPLERIYIQWNMSYYFPSITMDNHVTNSGKQSIKYRVDVASMGKLGFDLNLKELHPEEVAFCKQAVTNYNGFKDLIWHGDIYRIRNPYEKPTAAIGYVNKEKTKAIVFNYLTNWRVIAEPDKDPIQIPGLDPNKNYKVKELNLYANQATTLDESKIYSGEYLMNIGINPNVTTDRSSVVLSVEAQ